MRQQGLLAVALAFALATAVPAPAAAAGPHHFSFHVDAVIDPECGDMAIHYEGFAHGTFRLKQRRDGRVFGQGTFHEKLRATNLDTGRVVEYDVNGIDKDLRVRDNGDGTLTILVAFSGGERLSDPDGGIAYQAAGTTTRELLVDTLGTANPDDDVLLEERVVKQAGRRTASGYCEALRAATS